MRWINLSKFDFIKMNMLIGQWSPIGWLNHWSLPFTIFHANEKHRSSVRIIRMRIHFAHRFHIRLTSHYIHRLGQICNLIYICNYYYYYTHTRQDTTRNQYQFVCVNAEKESMWHETRWWRKIIESELKKKLNDNAVLIYTEKSRQKLHRFVMLV